MRAVCVCVRLCSSVCAGYGADEIFSSTINGVSAVHGDSSQVILSTPFVFHTVQTLIPLTSSAAFNDVILCRGTNSLRVVMGGDGADQITVTDSASSVVCGDNCGVDWTSTTLTSLHAYSTFTTQGADDTINIEGVGAMHVAIGGPGVCFSL